MIGISYHKQTEYNNPYQWSTHDCMALNHLKPVEESRNDVEPDVIQ